ncbi:hypothetical protein BV898_11014 [Hypsibius exemplaris]|uniref:Uncharacterized protein n=1 Tax=Hypsibius exemplaris TaxID=2072580 RepID=A0A1W0WHR8_HYPEX|nr:hypothetical protein BV898_11014 [Hypsibius exemplaris]
MRKTKCARMSRISMRSSNRERVCRFVTTMEVAQWGVTWRRPRPRPPMGRHLAAIETEGTDGAPPGGD